MKSLFRKSLLFAFMFVSAGLSAQTQNYREMHKVKKGETIFGICKKYEITMEQLIAANPDMNALGYELKKGDYIFIPYPAGKAPAQKTGEKPAAANTSSAAASAARPAKPASSAAQAQQRRVVRVGVMLPLHNVDGDGRRMVEYYRGLLMGCDKLRKEGVSIDVRAWNVPIDADITKTLADEGAAQCDIIFGPLYSSQVAALSEFSRKHGTKVVIPFSINGNEVERNANIFQVYQSPQLFSSEVVKDFAGRFAGCQVVVVDCNDKSSDKGVFTTALRKKLAESNMPCSITNLTNSDEYFQKAFSSEKQNVVVLNTGRSPELNAVIQRLDALKAKQPGLKITLFGYTEWLMYAKYNLDKFCRYDTYVPTHFYYNPLAKATQAFESEYRQKFDQSLLDYMPRFAITGYDHALFFLRGVNAKGKQFTGAEADKNAIQTQLHFKRAGSKDGGLQNVAVSFVHYNTNHSISIINY